MNPSESGSATEFSIGSTSPYTDGYWWVVQVPVNSAFTHLTYAFDLYVPLGSETLPQAIEFECQQQLGGYIYNFAWQADYGRATWRIFDYVNRTWDTVAIPFAGFAPGTWHHIVAEYHNDATLHQVVHDALTVDGVRYTVGAVHQAKLSGDYTSSFTNAVQLDTNNVGTGYSVYIDQMTIGWQ